MTTSITTRNTRRLAAILAAAALLALAPGAPAGAQGMGAGQRPMTPQQQQARAAAMKADVYKKLALTPAQISKVEAIERKYRNLMQTRITALRKKYGANSAPDQQQKAMAELQPLLLKMRTDSRREFLAVLTPAQRKKAQAMMPGGAGAKP